MRSGLGRLLTFEVHGQRLRFYPTDLTAELWFDPGGRASDNRILKAYLKPGECYIDVGANIGSTVIAGAAAVGSTGRVLAVEPHPRIFKYMVGNVALNGITNVVARNVALADRLGSASFSDSKTDDQNHVELAGDGTLTVQLATLDSLSESYPSVALLKIDVEGFEAQVLGGAGETLDKTEAVYIEIADALLRKFGSSAEAVLRTLKTSGFQLLRWSDDNTLQVMQEVPVPFPEIDDVLAVRSIEQVRNRLAPSIAII